MFCPNEKNNMIDTQVPFRLARSKIFFRHISFLTSRLFNDSLSALCRYSRATCCTPTSHQGTRFNFRRADKADRSSSRRRPYHNIAQQLDYRFPTGSQSLRT